MSKSVAARLSSSIHSFIRWLDRVGYDSYDPYDLWGTRYGLFARRLYYEKNPFGLPLIAPIVAIETLCPSLRKLFVCKQRFATADAQLLLGFLNLHALESVDRDSPLRLDRGEGQGEVSISDSNHAESISSAEPGCGPQASAKMKRLLDQGFTDLRLLPSALCPLKGEVSKLPASHLQRARDLASDLLKISIPGYSGHCWGYPFDWQNNCGLWKRNTPFITSTPYCYEAFAKLYEATNDSKYLEVAESAARFVFQDLKDTPLSPDSAAGSYGPLDSTQVINASAYRAFLLFDAARRFDIPEYERKAHANLNFILENQRPDGSWLYALNSPGEAFIDHFHTCFVLKNLFKINQSLRSARIRESVHKGYAYYRRDLFDENGLPKSFAIQPRTQLVRLEMYNVAEAITLGALLREEIPAAFAHAQRLAELLIERYQLRDGHFLTRVFLGGLRHTFPFLRWPQAQLFYALTNLLWAVAGRDARAAGSTSIGTLSTPSHPN